MRICLYMRTLTLGRIIAQTPAELLVKALTSSHLNGSQATDCANQIMR